MKMVLSSFVKQHNIKTEATKKTYFKEYVFKVVMNAPFGRILHDCKKKGTVKHAIDTGIKGYETLLAQIMNQTLISNSQFRWRVTHYEDQIKRLKDLDQPYFDRLLKVVNDIPSLRYSTTGYSVTFFFKTESDLEDAIKILDEADYNKIVTIFYPDTETIPLLQEGKILTNIDPKFKYKISVRSGRYSAETRSAISEVLSNHASIVKIPKRLENFLAKQGTFFCYNCYFYTNSTDILFLLSLIDPKFVGTTNELVNVNSQK